MAEITRKSVLLECLSIMRQELALTSERYDGLSPKKGMEDAWAQCRQKIEILKDMIHAYESPTVRAAMSNWEKEIIEKNSIPYVKALAPKTPEEKERIMSGEWEPADWQKEIMERNGEPEATMDGDFLAALDGLTPAQMEQLKRGEWELENGQAEH